jgi:hypothetical protein
LRISAWWTKRSIIAGDDLVAEDLAPGREGLVRGDDQRGALVARGDEHVDQVGSLWVERDGADLVTDQKRDAPEPAQFLFESALALRLTEPGDPFGRGGEADTLAGEAGTDPERDREMRLPRARGSQSQDVGRSCRKSSWPRCSISVFLTERWKLKSNSSSVFRAGKRPAGILASPPCD